MAKQFPASKAQLKRLAELGIPAPTRISYTDAAVLLEQHGWDATGTTQSDTPHATAHAEAVASRDRGSWYQRAKYSFARQTEPVDEEDADILAYRDAKDEEGR